MADPFQSSGGVTIQGDPIQALAAQVNRITRQTTFTPAPGQLTRDLATSAIVLMQGIALAAAPSDPYAAQQATELAQAIRNPTDYVSARVTQITQALAVYGDAKGLPPAKVGITRRDPRFAVKWDGWMWAGALAAGLSVAIGAATLARRLGRA